MSELRRHLVIQDHIQNTIKITGVQRRMDLITTYLTGMLILHTIELIIATSLLGNEA